MSPAPDKVSAFLASNPDWIFFSGHFLNVPLSLFSEGGTSLDFAEAAVTVSIGGLETVVKKGTAAFGLDKQCKVVLWGGCSACHKQETGRHTVSIFFKLFGPHVLLGY